ncbi:PAS domain S-box protein [Sphingomonas sp. KRR8]|uniref:PAS domain S-box protein n=1 Tax=Sphingomonas sp. KRR8 TaxID=2942996 RepID=UPI002021D389|nr:PAS domain S-box protein [Sphingomonas sp. KRR8]URD61867.1 PAS domain S-box protein [Sphingomonas sp. KRR8]
MVDVETAPATIAPEIFEALADNLPQLAWIADASGFIYWYNRRWYEFTGTDLAQMQGWGWQSVHHPDEVERVTASWKAALDKGVAWEDTFPLRSAGGEYRHFLSRANPLRNDQGEITNWFGTNTDITEELRSKDELKEAQQRLGAALEASQTGTFFWNMRTNALDWDEALDGLFGLPAGETARSLDQFLAMVHPDDRAGVVEQCNRCISEGADFDMEFRVVRPDGSTRWLRDRGKTMLDEKGKPLLLSGACVDVTDLRRAETEARLTAQEVSTIYETAPVGLTVIGRDKRYVRINQRLAEINGVPPEEHIGRTLREIVPDIAPEAEELLDRVLQGEEIWNLEISGTTARQPGVVRTWRENWIPLRDQSGEIVGAAISADDVTQQKENEGALTRSESQFRTVADALPGMLFVTDPSGDNLYVNGFFRDYTGFSEEELLGGGWSKVVNPDDLPRVNEIVNVARAEKRMADFEHRLRRKDGEWRLHRTRAAPVLGADGDIQQWIGVSIDVHDQRRVERELRESEAFARRISDIAPAILYVYDMAERRNVWGNREMVEVLGYSAAQIESFGGEIIGRLMHPDDLARYPEHISRIAALSDGEMAQFKYRFRRPDCSWVWLLSHDMVFRRDADGQPTQIIGAALDITEQENAVAALRQSEERYRALFESMEQGFCVIEVLFDGDHAVDHRFIELNPAFSVQSGLPQEVLGKSVRDVVPELEDRWGERYGEIARSGISQRFVERAEPLGRWFEVYAFRIGDPTAQQVAILFTDVTEREQRDRDLQLRLNAIPQMVWSSRPDGFHDFYNERWYEFTGTPLGSTDGEGWNDMFHPDDQDRAWSRWRDSLETGKPYEIEYRLRHRSGEYRWVLGRALPVRDERGVVIRWMGTCTDVDDGIRAREALAESEATLRAVIDSMPVGLMFADASGRLTGRNQWIEKILGMEPPLTASPKEYERDYVAFHADGSRVESHQYPLAQVLTGDHSRPELECLVERGDCSRSWVRYVAAPIEDADGRLMGGVVASIDIDREKRLAAGLEREVEKVIAEREAAQEALRQSQKLEAMGQLTGGVAHDFNNLLTPIIGSLDLLHRKELGDARTRRLINGALQSAERAKTLVQRLLAFARRQPLQPTAVDVGRIVQDMASLISSTAGPRIKVNVAIAPDLPPAHADSNQLEMALLNLSVNARDALPSGGELTIDVREATASASELPDLAGRSHILLTVTDNGLGMDEETLARCIEPFFSTKGIGKGTGLGLSMVHGLAAQLGGALRINSKEGEGTSIELWLPVSSEAVGGGNLPGETAEGSGQGVVLLVDDEDLVRDSTASMLTDLGYRVVEANSAEQALALVKGGLQPDMLVSDHLMPGLSGTDLAVRLRARLPSLPVLIVSGYADVDSLTPAFPRLTKPFREADMAAALAALRGEMVKSPAEA